MGEPDNRLGQSGDWKVIAVRDQESGGGLQGKLKRGRASLLTFLSQRTSAGRLKRAEDQEANGGASLLTFLGQRVSIFARKGWKRLKAESSRERYLLAL